MYCSGEIMEIGHGNDTSLHDFSCLPSKRFCLRMILSNQQCDRIPGNIKAFSYSKPNPIRRLRWQRRKARKRTRRRVRRKRRSKALISYCLKIPVLRPGFFGSGP
jgi:hypothetical protein